MATDQALPFADVDEALFDQAQIPLAQDVRSVGEMLFDVDHLARQLLMDVSGEDASALLRGWPRVIGAAGELWQALPGRRPGHDERDTPMRRLDAQAATIREAMPTTNRWPGTGPGDARLEQMTDTLARATALVERYGVQVRHEQPDAHRDLEAARTRVMHALYVATHAVGVALHAHGRNLFEDARSAGRPVPMATNHSPYVVAPTASWLHRIGAAEEVARGYLMGRFVEALRGEAAVPLVEGDRVSRALAGWDIQAHRSLAAHSSPANVHLIARTQGLVLSSGLTLVDAAHRAGFLTDTERLTHAMTKAGQCWSRVATRWGDLTPPAGRLDGPLVRAAAEVRSAYRELTHDATTMAPREVIAGRDGLVPAVRASLQMLEGDCELAHAVAQRAKDPDLVGPARALSIRASSSSSGARARTSAPMSAPSR